MTRMIKRLTVIALLAWSGAASASPALDLFNQATYYIQTRYNGFSAAAEQDFAALYRPDLETACAAERDTCPYSVAVPFVDRMLEAISDGHSYRLSSEQRDEMRRQRTGLGPSSPRLGIVTRAVEGSADRLVSDVWEFSPAAKAGLQRGDRLTGVNGQPSATLGADFQTTIARAVATGQPVRLSLTRADQPLEITVTGAALPARLPSFKVIASSSTGYLRIPSFDVAGQVATAVHNLVRKAQSAGVKRLVVDVRDNPGGIDFEVLAATSAFVKRTGFTQAYRDTERTQIAERGVVQLTNGVTIYSTPNPTLFTGRIAVLVNSHSYSGAEYLAQFVQDAKAGVVVGEITGGLGNTGSTEFNLPDGSALVLTIFKSLRLDGSYLPERVTPDELVPSELEAQALAGRDVTLQRALEMLARP
jgi:carboxyl-terminal processing protease